MTLVASAAGRCGESPYPLAAKAPRPGLSPWLEGNDGRTALGLPVQLDEGPTLLFAAAVHPQDPVTQGVGDDLKLLLVQASDTSLDCRLLHHVHLGEQDPHLEPQ